MIPGQAQQFFEAAAAQAGDAGYQIERSLRFESGDSANLARTPSSAGNRKTWTLSVWLKRGKLSTSQRTIFSGGTTQNNTGWNGLYIFQDKLMFGGWNNNFLITEQLFRDASAWYHFVVALDTTQSSASNRLKMYVNGAEITDFSTDDRSTYITQNIDLAWNQAALHNFGQQSTGSAGYFNGYLADAQFVDGQALAPTDFGETNDDGLWVPKEASFTSPNDGTTWSSFLSTAAGFNRAATLAFDGDIFSTANTPSNTGGYYTGETNAFEFIPSSSIPFTSSVKVTGRGTGQTTGKARIDTGSGYGGEINLSSDGIETVISGSGNLVKLKVWTVTYAGENELGAILIDDVPLVDGAGAYGTNGFHLDFSDNSSNAALGLDSSGNNNTWTVNNITANTAGPIITSVKAYSVYNGASVSCNYTVDYSDNGSDWTNAFSGVMGNGGACGIFSGTNPGDGSYGAHKYWRYVVGSVIVSHHPRVSRIMLSDGSSDFEIASFTSDNCSDSGGIPGTSTVYSYTDTTTGADVDSLRDSPTNGTQSDTGTGGEVSGNYCTLNPLLDRYNIGSSGTKTFSQGNLKIVATTGDSTRSRYLFGTIGVSSGKWYYEMTADDTAGGISVGFAPRQYADEISSISVRYNSPGSIQIDGTTYSSLASFTNGDVIGVALDLDGNTVQFYKNGSTVGSAYSVSSGYTYLPLIVIPSTGTSSTGATFNFGQRAWAYSAPSNHKALCTKNLPTPTIADGRDNFQTKTYTGTGATQSITTTDLSPDLVWTKRRDGTSSHGWFDIVRGATKWIGSNSAGAEGTYSDSLTSFDAQGFTLGADTVWNGINQSGYTYVAWCWDGGSSTESNGDGTITSNVRANPTAGFSIVSYSGNATAGATVGHGLNDVPAMYIVKRLDGTDGWYVYHKDLTTGKVLILNTTDGENTSSFTNGTEPTSSVFSLGSASSFNGSGSPFISYCFTPVEGYSAFGTYTGNGSSDGPFVYTGFRVAWYLIKKTDSGGENWRIIDAIRSPINVAENRLLPNSTAAEGAQPDEVDFLSNGFKFRSADGAYNGSGSTYIFAAFASNPFQTNGGLAR